jgi:arylsulfatase A-like enzyme
MGNKYISTPGMDRIYKQGTVFTNAYSTNPVCGPARSSILTGRMPCETGVYNNGLNIRNGIPHLGQWFTKHGYNSIYAGKWHLRQNSTSVIDGFDVIMTKINVQGNTSDTCITSATEAYLRNYDSDKPFLMMAMYTQPHDICGFVNYFRDEQDMLYEIPDSELPELPPNFDAEPEEPDRFRKFKARIPSTRGNWNRDKWRRYLWNYYRYVEGVDLEINRLLDVLDETGFAENTIVVFMSDHGENTANHRTTLKTSFYNESCRVPMAIREPGRENMKIVTNPVSLMDIFPTLCDYADIDKPGKMTGINIADGSFDRKGVPIENYNGSGRAFVTEEYKYIAFNDGDTPQLFNLTKDPYETKNIHNDRAYSKIVAALNREMVTAFAGLDVAECVPDDSRW